MEQLLSTAVVMLCKVWEGQEVFLEGVGAEGIYQPEKVLGD